MPTWRLPTLAQLPDEPVWHDCVAGEEFVRVIPRDGDPLWFNPNDGSDPGDCLRGGRFHPFESASGARVPTLYLGSELKAAIAETLLHDLPLTPLDQPYTVSLAKVAAHRFTVIKLVEGLRLIELSRLGADRVRIPSELIAWCARDDYPTTREAAKLLHTKYPEAQGLHWVSRRYSPESCVVVFGDRVASARDLFAVRSPERRDLHAPGMEGYAALESVLIESGTILTP